MIERAVARNTRIMLMHYKRPIIALLFGLVGLVGLPACSGDDRGEAEEAAENPDSTSESESAESSTAESSTAESSTAETSTAESSTAESSTAETSTETSGETSETSTTETESGSDTAGTCQYEGGEVGPEPNQCAAFATCDSFMDHQVNCSADGCRCIVDGIDVGSCEDSTAVCEAVSGGNVEVLVACCGWML